MQVDLFDSEGGTFATYRMETVYTTSDVFGTSRLGATETLHFVYGMLTSTITLNGMTYSSCWDQVHNSSC